MMSVTLFVAGIAYGLFGLLIIVWIDHRISRCIDDWVGNHFLRFVMIFIAWPLVVLLAIARYERKHGPLQP